MTQTLKTTERLGVVDALRGFALLAIVLLHNLEHYNLFLPLDYTLPAWLQTIDKYAWDTMFFLFAGKAYATFSLLFGFSFYIQFHNAEKRGTDFRGRFAWRMCLLFLFAQLHALFYNGDILLLYAVVGFALIPVCKLKDKTVFWIAAILLLQPYEWGRAINGGKPVPATTGEVMQTIYNSLSHDYQAAIQELQSLTGKEYTSINIVGGGSQDMYLNQMTANATQLPVFAGPTEGTALGNLMVQMIRAGEFKDLADARASIKKSFTILECNPQ